MIEPCQDLAFRSEAPQDLSGVRAPIQYLDRDLFFKLTISALSQENCAHPAAAKFTDDDIRADALSAVQVLRMPPETRS